jgi:hypothetical protein
MSPQVTKTLVLTIILIGLLCLPLSARIRHVPGDYSTIQAGINDCSGGDTLLVHPGTYTENINFNGQYLTLASMFLTTGEFSYIESTVIDGGGETSAVTVNHGEGRDAKLIGFTIQNGREEEGGGIHISHSDPVIAYNIIKNNEAHMTVGGGEGGAIYCYMCSPLITNNLMYGNWTSGNYGGSGGAMYCDQASPVLINNTITRNNSNSLGGGIRCYRTDAIITNTIIWNNYAPDEGENIHITECNPSFTYCDIYAGWQGMGNINSNPEFRDPGNGDFHLMSTGYGNPYDSPCIDMGNPDIRDHLLDSLWGLGTTLSDIGAFGGSDSAGVGIDDLSDNVPLTFSLGQNYPNPFNPGTTISFTLAESQPVSLRVYDLLGREIAKLHDGPMPAGRYDIRFDAGNLPSGMYFYTLQANGHSQSRSMILLK